MDSEPPFFSYDSIKADVNRLRELLKSEDDCFSNDNIQLDLSNDTEITEPPFEHIAERGTGDDGNDPVAVNHVDYQVPDENIDAALQTCAKMKECIMRGLEKFDGMLNEIDQKQDCLTERLGKAKKLEREKRKKVKYYKPISLFTAPYFRDVEGRIPPPNEDSIMKKANDDIDAYIAPPRAWTAQEHKFLREIVIENARCQELKPLFASREHHKEKLVHDVFSDEQVVDIEEKLGAIANEIENIRKKSDDQFLQLDQKLDWMRIAASLPDISRAPDECERMWRGYLHPSINKKKWTEEEDNELRKVAAKHGYQNWEQIASELTLSRRTGIQCMQRYQSTLNNTMVKSVWTPEDDEELLSVVESCRIGNYIPWNQVSYNIEGRRQSQIISRWTRSIAPNLKKAPWSPEEDAILLAAVDRYGHKWTKMRDLLPGRSNFSCRERYTNVLAPGVTAGNWTREEDRLLIKLARQHPEGRRSKIAEHFDGRTGNMCLQRVSCIRKYHPHLVDPNIPFSDIEEDLETEELVTPTHNCKTLNTNCENIRRAAEETLTKTVMKIRGYKTVEEAREALKSMKASRTFLLQLSRELLSEEGKNTHKRKVEKKAEKSNHTKRKRVQQKPALHTERCRKRLASARQAHRSELFDDTDSETESGSMSFHDDDEDDEDFSEMREQNEEFYAERRTAAVKHERTEEEEAVDAELDSLFLPLVVSGIRLVKKNKCVYQSARHVLERKLVKPSLYEALHCVEDEVSDDEEESHEGTEFRGIDYAISVPHVLRNFVFDSSVQEEIPVFPPNHLSLQAFKFLLINYKQMLHSLSQNPCQDSHIISITSSQEIYTLVCASCYKTRGFELQSDVVVNVPDFSPDRSEDQNRTDSAKSSSDGGLDNGEPKDNEVPVTPCVECQRLNVVRKDYHLLRKRLFSLFFWPALLTMTEPTDKQISVSNQGAATKTRNKTPVKKCVGSNRQCSTHRGRSPQSDTEEEATAVVACKSQTKCPPPVN